MIISCCYSQNKEIDDVEEWVNVIESEVCN